MTNQTEPETADESVIFHPHKKGRCPCCMADPLCPQSIVALDYDSGFCIDCHIADQIEREFHESN